MKRFLRLITLGVALGFLAGCDAGPTQQPVAQAPTPAAQQQQVEAQTSAEKSWFPAADAKTPVADNLLADNWVYVFDDSGSMGDSACGTGNHPRIETAKDAVIAFDRALPATANRGLVTFPAVVQVTLGAVNRIEFEKKVKAIRAGGGTPLRTAMKAGVSMLVARAQMQRGYGTYHLVVVTDGEADWGENPADFTKGLVKTTPIDFNVIGFCVDGRHSLDIPGYTRYAAAKNPETLEKGLKAILQVESDDFAASGYQPN